MAATAFDLDRARLEAAQRLPPECFDDFQRLVRSIVHGPAFQWLIVDAPHDALRMQVMTALDEVLRIAGLQVHQVKLGRGVPDVPALERKLLAAAGRFDVVHVLGARGWFDAAAWDAFNVRRERLAAGVKARLVFWLDADAIALASLGAPDLWAWRAGVYAFRPARYPAASITLPAQDTFKRRHDPVWLRPMPDKHRRINEIKAWLAAHPDAPDELLIAPLDELGMLLHAAGEFDAALRHWRERELPLYRRLHDDLAIAATMGQIADVLQARGDFDEALRIRREEELPVYERFGEVLPRAFTMSRIADVLQARGDLEEALRIRREEELPVYEKLGNLRARAMALGRIADIQEARGDLDEALRIRREEELPVYEKLGDLLARAVTMGQIADVVQARGDLDEALRIRREEELPVYEKLGELRERAVAMGKIADVLQARGDRAEALRIRLEEELPVYEKLGEFRERALTEWRIALELWDRGRFDEARSLFLGAYTALHGAGLPEAAALAHHMHQRGLPAPGP